jgi:four helix bundle protein
MSNHKDLVAWREAMSLVEAVYRDTENFPRDETFGLRAQVRRAAVSVPSNIAEGSGRNSPGELRQFVGIASGSLAELETQLELSVRLGSWSPAPRRFARRTEWADW